VFTGCDDNTAIYKTYKDHGGRGLFKTVPETTPWYKAESSASSEETAEEEEEEEESRWGFLKNKK
jgi:hypothetical protein